MREFLFTLIALRQSRLFMDFCLYTSDYDLCRIAVYSDEYINHVRKQIEKTMAMMLPTDKMADKYLEGLLQCHSFRLNQIREHFGFFKEENILN